MPNSVSKPQGNLQRHFGSTWVPVRLEFRPVKVRVGSWGVLAHIFRGELRLVLQEDCCIQELLQGLRLQETQGVLQDVAGRVKPKSSGSPLNLVP